MEAEKEESPGLTDRGRLPIPGMQQPVPGAVIISEPDNQSWVIGARCPIASKFLHQGPCEQSLLTCNLLMLMHLPRLQVHFKTINQHSGLYISILEFG